MGEDVITIPESQGGYRTPTSLIDAISDIQQYAVLESEGATDLPKDYLTPKRVLAYFGIGFNYGIGDGLLLFFFAPFLFAALEGMIPVFGRSPELFDKIYIFILSKYFSIGLFFLMVYVLSKAKGSVSKGLVHALVGGYASACAVRVFVFLFLYRIIYQNWGVVKGTIAEYYETFMRASGESGLGQVSYWAGVILWKLYFLAERVEPVIIKTSNYESLFHIFLLMALMVSWIYYTRIKYRLVKNPYYGRFS